MTCVLGVKTTRHTQTARLSSDNARDINGHIHRPQHRKLKTVKRLYYIYAIDGATKYTN